MTIIEGLRVAFGSLLANKLRSVLTMLGVIIGVAAVIALISIGQGVQAQVREQIQGAGANQVTIIPGSRRANGVGFGAGSADTLSYEDAQAIASSGAVTKARAVAPSLNRTYQVVAGSANESAAVVGTTPEYALVTNSPAARGEFITASHLAAGSQVAVLGATLAETLFGPLDPVGREVKINRLTFTVVGVLKAKGGGGLGSEDEAVYVPLTTMYQKLAGARRAGSTVAGRAVSQISIQAIDERSVDGLVAEVTALLRGRHRLPASVEDDFEVINLVQLLQTITQVTGVLTLFLGAVAGISLLVGGIGIMNIMLVSVTQRTREIGIRKAIGARRRDILGQFLIESVVLSLGGGLIGMALGVGVAQLVNLTGQLRAEVGAGAILLAVGVAGAVGIFFGLFPAQRAASLRPVEALRYE